jgi:hypothetical protein
MGCTMPLRDDIKRLQYRFSLASRQKKFDLFWEPFQPAPGERVLNIGGTPPHLGRAFPGEYGAQGPGHVLA